jgi:hypothetical protein
MPTLLSRPLVEESKPRSRKTLAHNALESLKWRVCFLTDEFFTVWYSYSQLA